jgi:hypothetical protein
MWVGIPGELPVASFVIHRGSCFQVREAANSCHDFHVKTSNDAVNYLSNLHFFEISTKLYFVLSTYIR